MTTRVAIAVAALGAACAVAASAHAAPRERQHAARMDQHVVLGGQVSIGKPTAPIAVSYELGAEPALGQPLTLRIVAQAAEDVTNVTLELTADDALHVGPVAPASALAPTDHVWTLTVTPLREGRGQLNVSVTGRIDGHEQTRSVLIPIRTAAPAGGDPAARRNAAERVISLPAEER